MSRKNRRGARRDRKAAALKQAATMIDPGRRPIYALSEAFGPPRTDLRAAEIADSYGDTAHATRPIAHQTPRDVTREDLDAYPRVFPFMDARDLLFYLYPVARHTQDAPDNDWLESYLFNLDTRRADVLMQLTDDRRATLIDALRWIQGARGGEFSPISVDFTPALYALVSQDA